MERPPAMQTGFLELGVAGGADDVFGQRALPTAGTHVIEYVLQSSYRNQCLSSEMLALLVCCLHINATVVCLDALDKHIFYEPPARRQFRRHVVIQADASSDICHDRSLESSVEWIGDNRKQVALLSQIAKFQSPFHMAQRVWLDDERPYAR
jgi:hypothetical protein